MVGDARNLAARLQQLAEPGTVVIAESTRKLLGRRFELRELGSVKLKGFAEPVTAFSVVGLARFETRFESERETGLSAFVGREPEIALLSACWDAVNRGEGRAILISGEGGIGKSRLIAQLEQLDRIEALIGSSMRAAESERVAPLIADMLSIPIDGRYSPLQQSAAQRRRHLLAAVLDYIESLTRKQPLVVFFEDLHWADATTLEVLNLLISRIRGLRILLLMTCRPEFKATWTEPGNVTSIALGRLEPASVRELIASLLGGMSLPTAVLEQIATNADGVPLFIEEITKMVLETGLLTCEGDRFGLQGSLSRMGIPATLQDSMMARLDRMAPVRNVAQIAAALGREFSFQLLHKVSGRDTETLATALARLGEAGLVLQTSGEPNARHRFRHSLLQNAAYETLLKSARQVLHNRIATVLCDHFPAIGGWNPR